MKLPKHPTEYLFLEVVVMILCTSKGMMEKYFQRQWTNIFIL